jgi:hypothetical protein
MQLRILYRYSMPSPQIRFAQPLAPACHLGRPSLFASGSERMVVNQVRAPRSPLGVRSTQERVSPANLSTTHGAATGCRGCCAIPASANGRHGSAFHESAIRSSSAVQPGTHPELSAGASTAAGSSISEMVVQGLAPDISQRLLPRINTAAHRIHARARPPLTHPRPNTSQKQECRKRSSRIPMVRGSAISHAAFCNCLAWPPRPPMLRAGEVDRVGG